jgi:hypothetical protein
MNCTEWEERVALYAGGDLDVRNATEVKRHLGDCPSCQLFASGLAESLACLKSAHAEEIAPAHYAALRARVMAAVDRDRRGLGWVWIFAATAVAAALLVAFGLRLRVPELPPVAVRTARPPAGWEAVERRPASPPQRSIAAWRPPRTQRPQEQVLVKIETDDPDIVVFWIAETKGEN